MTSILYHSTNLKTDPVSFKSALLKGLAPDKGLYMPDHIPAISRAELAGLAKATYAEVAFDVLNRFLAAEVSAGDLKQLVTDAYDFEVPLEPVHAARYVMRLDQGPTASFKDFAARMMGRLMQYYLNQEKKDLFILTATSGDTGSAIANAFYGLSNIRVMILFPEKEVTPRQRKQMTTLGKNIEVIAIDGKFDDCQALVKRAFVDDDLAGFPLSSANSINIGRLLPQIVYYVYAYARLAGQSGDDVIFSVPSGNFGNMMGGLLAMHMGVPIKKFIIATNENDEFPRFMKTGLYEKIEPSKNCLSSAMNVGHPSNLARVVALYGGVMDEQGVIAQAPDLKKMNHAMHAVSISDRATKATIKSAFDRYKLLLEPHGAVAWAALAQYLNDHPEDEKGVAHVSLETAHPAKFPETIREILNFDPELPKSLEGIEEKKEVFERMENCYEAFKEQLISS